MPQLQYSSMSNMKLRSAANTDKSLRPPVNFVIARKAGPWPNGRAPALLHPMGAMDKTNQEDTEC
nr:hypothetical protein [uncultured Duganella sp.]